MLRAKSNQAGGKARRPVGSLGLSSADELQPLAVPHEGRTVGTDVDGTADKLKSAGPRHGLVVVEIPVSWPNVVPIAAPATIGNAWRGDLAVLHIIGLGCRHAWTSDAKGRRRNFAACQPDDPEGEKEAPLPCPAASVRCSYS
jgi:hypothetical protein